jgi:hypothetical protein
MEEDSASEASTGSLGFKRWQSWILKNQPCFKDWSFRWNLFSKNKFELAY